MPVKSGKSGLVAKLGAKLVQAHEAHKSDETTYGQSASLPAGIEDGVAQLVDMKFAQYKDGDLKGEYYFYAAGVVVEPQEFEGKNLAKRRTTFMEPMCDTPKAAKKKTLADHDAVVLNVFRQFGIDTKKIGPEDYEATAAGLVAMGPYFKFRTWKGKKQETGPYAGKEPRVVEEWNGIIKDYSHEVSDEVNEEGEEEVEVQEEEVESNEVEVGEELDLDALAEAADGGDEESAGTLTEHAKSLGFTEEELQSEDLPNWAAVVEAIRARESGEGGETEVDYAALGEAADGGDEASAEQLKALGAEVGLDSDEFADSTWVEFAEMVAQAASGEEVPEPLKKGDTRFYKPAGAKTAVKCEVVSVDLDKGECTLKKVSDKKMLMDVKTKKPLKIKIDKLQDEA